MLPIPLYDVFDFTWPPYLPFHSDQSEIKTIELHFDIDLAKTQQDRISARDYGDLAQLDGLNLVVDIHIVCAWDETDGTEWLEPITRRQDISEARALELDSQASRMRSMFIEDLGAIFKANGTSFVIRDN